MGSSRSRSSVRTENHTTVVNRSDIEMLNSNMNEVVANVVKKTDQSCENRIAINNVIDFSRARIYGNLNIGAGPDCGVELSTDSTVTFQCVNATDVVNDVGSSMVDEMMQGLETHSSTDAMNSMKSAADSEATTGFLSIGAADSSSSNESINKFKQVNETKQNLQNIVANSVSNNLTEETVSNCINRINMKQGIDASGSEIGGDVNICNYASDIVADVFVDCLNDHGTSSKISNDVARDLGVEIIESTETATTSEMDATATSTATMEGVMASLASLPSIISGVVACVCCIIVAVIVFTVVSGSSGSQNTALDATMMNASNFGAKNMEEDASDESE